jgi:transglutaminase-like putative cysteine protease
LRISHTTNVKYSRPVLTSFNEARMTPLTLPTQITLESRVTVGPGPVPVWAYSDYWGTFVSVFELPDAHDDLVVRAVSTVETEPFPGIPGRVAAAVLGRADRRGRQRAAPGDDAADPTDDPGLVGLGRGRGRARRADAG